MKIAILCPTFFTYSGIDRVVEQQAKDFAELENDITIFTLQSEMKPPSNVKIEIINMPKGFFLQRIYRLLFPLDFAKAIKWVPKLRYYDVIYSHQYPMNWLAYLAKRFYGTKYIYYNHGYAPPSTFSNFIEQTYERLLMAFANWTIRRADGAISDSQYLQQQLKKETGLDSKVVYCKIDFERFNQRIDGEKIRQKYNLGGDPVVLFVGRISPHKGIHLLIQAFNLVRQDVPEAKLLIVGKHTISSYSRRLERMNDGSVIFVDVVHDEDLPSYYAACNVYATASLWEGFDLPLAEAQACRKPAVAFDIGPHPEVIKNPNEVKLVPAGDTEAMAKAIISFLKAKPGNL